MRCSVCRKEYFTTHDCPGTLYMGDVSRPAGGLAVGYYLSEAVRILRLDHLAIRRIEHDPKSLVLSIPAWYLVTFLALLPNVLVNLALKSELTLETAIAAWILSFLFPLGLGVVLLVRLGIGHVLARWFFDGKGKYAGLLRPYILASVFLSLLGGVPFLGPIVGGIWGIAIFAWIFEEVEGVNRVQAVGISVVIGIVFWPAQAYLTR